MDKQNLCDLTRGTTITQLIGLGEVQREIYKLFKEKQGDLKEAYELHQRELELLIKYQKSLV